MMTCERYIFPIPLNTVIRVVGAYWFDVGAHGWEVAVIRILVCTPLMVMSRFKGI